jgi:hypothetical protein
MSAIAERSTERSSSMPKVRPLLHAQNGPPTSPRRAGSSKLHGVDPPGTSHSRSGGPKLPDPALRLQWPATRDPAAPTTCQSTWDTNPAATVPTARPFEMAQAPSIQQATCRVAALLKRLGRRWLRTPPSLFLAALRTLVCICPGTFPPPGGPGGGHTPWFGAGSGPNPGGVIYLYVVRRLKWS